MRECVNSLCVIVGGIIAMASMLVVTLHTTAAHGGYACQVRCNKLTHKIVRQGVASVGGTITAGTEMYVALQTVSKPTQMSSIRTHKLSLFTLQNQCSL